MGTHEECQSVFAVSALTLACDEISFEHVYVCVYVYKCSCVCVCTCVHVCTLFWFCIISPESALTPLGSGLSAHSSEHHGPVPKQKPSEARPIAGRPCGEICTISANQGDRKACQRGAPRVIKLRRTSRARWQRLFSSLAIHPAMCLCVCVCMCLCRTCLCVGSSCVSVFICEAFLQLRSVLRDGGRKDKHDRPRGNKKKHIRLPRCALRLPTAQRSGISQTTHSPPSTPTHLQSPLKGQKPLSSHPRGPGAPLHCEDVPLVIAHLLTGVHPNHLHPSSPRSKTSRAFHYGMIDDGSYRRAQRKRRN